MKKEEILQYEIFQSLARSFPGGEPMEKGKQYTLRDGDSFYVLSPEYTFKVVIENCDLSF